MSGPLGDPTPADYAIARSDGVRLGVVEMARASGLGLVDRRRRDPLRASTRGTGELILASVRRGASRVLVCVGGSATNDAGAGMAQALGVRLLDERGQELEPGGVALLALARIDMSGLDAALRGVGVIAAIDVDNPLVGPTGASVVYGPQKGASPEDVALLDSALRHFAAIVHRDLGIDLRATRGAGAAGGLGAGLIAFLGARLRPGVEVVMDAVRLRERLRAANLVITGEGSFDGQSLRGKAPAGVLRAAAELGVPALVLCGERQVGVEMPGVIIASLAERFGRDAALERPRALLADLAAEASTAMGLAGSKDERGADGEGG